MSETNERKYRRDRILSVTAACVPLGVCFVQAVFVGVYEIILIWIMSLLLLLRFVFADKPVRILSLSFSDKNKPLGKNRVLKAVIGSLVILFIIFMVPHAFSGTLKYRYGFQKKYVNMSHNLGDTDYFPEKLPDHAEDFHTQFSPSIMQGTGHYCVCFTTDSETIEMYEKRSSENAIMRFPLEEYYDIESGSIEDREFSLKYKDEIAALNDSEYTSGTLTLFIDEYAKSHAEGAEVFIIDAVFDSNHPHCAAVIINKETNFVEFSRLG